MGYVWNRVDPDELKPGDHIYTWRAAFTYAHHGIYVGGNKVIHFTSDQENAKSDVGIGRNAKSDVGIGWNLSSSLPIPSSCLNSSSLNSSCLNPIDCGFPQHNCDSGSCLCTYDCGFHQPESGVTLSCLNCFSRTGSLYLYQYGVNKWVHMSRIRGGICTVKPSNPPQAVIYRAIYLLGEEKGFGDYNVARNNCEDFALYCKTELMIDGKLATGGSGQVNSILNAPWKPALVQMFQKVVFRTPMTPLDVAAMVGRYTWDRYKTDIGVRGDVIRVLVEDVGAFRLERGY
ncbi:putative LRAT domain-containing protein [Helianthus annuus]|uniref:LRAT-like domain-containing protein n=1 Tax=Helianthus annuus TaxID=4232 RepID=A0A251VCN4_HELAN|nr:uncharacterized protein LOC110930472 isoform X1 [Helianthus annuus]KAF5815900.1 putative LRAT-like domain-containing protein [Helianthus annuus]KAJ0594286.1 putative LRAT domain-containing protein [Helianthus annuus]KAJ0602438.1 putative LRAT domain-containing protein [Helianthus annuus]KAJ0609309.1 putative LRAT domain-containing protein [Helianthus annuus]KAJ0769367.1 putative LRAT domain-containing protein [Helianthus annuus]